MHINQSWVVPEFLVVHSNRTRSNGHTLNHTRFQFSWAKHDANNGLDGLHGSLPPPAVLWFCDSWLCWGRAAPSVCWGSSVTVPCSGVGTPASDSLSSPSGSGKVRGYFTLFRPTPFALPYLEWKNSWVNQSHLHIHLSPKRAHPTEMWAGAGWGSAACSPHRHPVTQQWALIAVPGTLLPPAPLISRLLSLFACVFCNSEGCSMKSGEQARRLNAHTCLSGKTAGTSPKTLILNT